MVHTIRFFVLFLVLAVPASAQAWVQSYQPFPNGEATVVLHRFCFLADCGRAAQADWQAVIQEALDAWNTAGARFHFTTRPVRSTDDPCNLPNAVAVILTAPENLCPGDGPLPGGEVSGRTEYGPGHRARIYINDDDDWLGYVSTQTNVTFYGNPVLTYLIHEFGHVVGLGHPDEAGQQVDAIMNSFVGGIIETTLFPDDVAGIQALYGVQHGRSEPEERPGVLENPGPGSFQSGIGFLSGWKCGAQDITIQIDGGLPMPVAMGMPRADTRAVCGGETDNGFIVQMNWNWLSEGTHTAIAADDGVEFARSTFTAMMTDTEFLSGLDAQCTISDFPVPGQEAVFRWNESTQHLELAAMNGMDTEPEPPPLSSPSHGAIYWVADSAIQRANLDGSEQEMVLRHPSFGLAHLSVDPIENKFYGMKAGGTEGAVIIQRVNFDGSQLEDLVHVHLRYPHRGQYAQTLVLDPVGRKMYWTVHTSATTGAVAIERANLDGSHVETVVSHPRFLIHLAVDSIGEKLYWMTWADPNDPHSLNQNALNRSNLDGSQEEIVFFSLSPYGRQPLVPDSIEGKLYWGERDPGRVLRANLDGTKRETLVDTGHHTPHDLAVDFDGGHLYWTDNSQTLRRAHLDGSHQETLMTGIWEFMLVIP